MKRRVVAGLLAGFVVMMDVAPVIVEAALASYTESVPIELMKGSVFTVTLPENIIGNMTTDTVDFEYSVQGEIASNQQVVIGMEDADTEQEGIQVTLTDMIGLEKDANVSLDKYVFNYDEIVEKNTQKGTLQVEGLTAGTWTGKASFFISLEQDDLLEAGLYDEQGKMAKSWQELLDSSIITVDGRGVLTAASGVQGKLVISSDVKNIGIWAFDSCSELTEVVIPDGVSSIGDNAFNCCDNLKRVTMPNSVTSIGDCAFYGCSSLTSIKLPTNLTTTIGEAAFKNCSSLENIKIPVGVTDIGGSTFAGCSNLVKAVISDSVTSIGDKAFEECSSLTNVNIPVNVTDIGGSAFAGCSSLAKVLIPDNVTSIEHNAFEGCSSITSIELSDNLTTIEEAAFKNCSSLIDIEIPVGVTDIGGSVFIGCSSLVTAVISDSVTSIGDNAFADCDNLQYIYYSGTATGSPWGANNATVTEKN